MERGLRISSCTVPAPDHFTTLHAGCRAQIDDMIRAADRVLVVFDDHQRIFVQRELRECIEQHGVVARMQADRGLIEHVAHALQVRAQLGREADALRLAAGEGRRGTIERR